MSPKRRKITIIDDNQSVLLSLERLLSLHLHYELACFSDAEDAFQDIINVNSNSLIMIDCNLPRHGGGFDLYKRIRRSGIECPIILFSIDRSVLEEYSNIEDLSVWLKDLEQDSLKTLTIRIKRLIKDSQISTDVSMLKTTVNQVSQILTNMHHTQTELTKKVDLLCSRPSFECCGLKNHIEPLLGSIERVKKLEEDQKVSLWWKLLSDPILKNVLVFLGTIVAIGIAWGSK